MGKKRFILVAVVLLIGAGLWGWIIAANTGVDFTLPVVKPAKAVAAAPVDAKTAWAKEWQAHVDSQDKTWGDILIKGCAAGMADFEVGRLDTDGDGNTDKVCWRAIQTGKYGDFIGVAVIAKDKDGNILRSGYRVLAAGPANLQPGGSVFGGTANLKVSQTSPVRIAVSRGKEAASLAWPANAKSEDVPLRVGAAN
jgi:hypothetical protein